MISRVLAGTLAGLAVTLAVPAVWLLGTDWLYEGRVLPGVLLEGEDVGGLTTVGLAVRAESIARPHLDRQLTLRAAAHESRLRARDLGLQVDAEATVGAAMAAGRTGWAGERIRDRLTMRRQPAQVRMAYRNNAQATRAAIRAIAAQMAATPRDAEVDVVAGRLVVRRPSEDGVTVDQDAAVTSIASALSRGESEVALTISARRPVFTTEMAAQMAEPVARFTTWFPANPDRAHNIRLAAGALRGVLLLPGEALSYNQAVGPRTPERGYRKAPVLINDEFVPGDGGGVCQVSSTLFNAGVLAEMAVESRTNHSRPVAYLPAGRDATVEYGAIDLRLRNTTPSPQLLWTEVGPRSLTITVFGVRQPGREVAIVVTDQRVIPAPSHTIVRRDRDLPRGEMRIEPARPGLRVRMVRRVRQDGIVVRQEVVASSYYSPAPRTVFVGSRGVPPRVAHRAHPVHAP